ncbi:MAG TPA: ribosome silencing factor [Rhabdochlamydiaceae bacterium]|nr:ribosome silencing factor [Rhabdochlamydiaceae bacterium]
MLNSIAQIIYDKKGINTLVLDVRGVSTITDYAVIAEGNVDKHVIAIAHAIQQVMSERGESPAYVEGMQTGDWVVLDYIEVMVHLFMPGLRDKYQLEKLWKEGKIVDVKINTSPSESMAYASKAQKIK